MPAAAEPNRNEADRLFEAEWKRFTAALPKLLEDPALRGRWVVFKDGKVAKAFDERTAGRRWAVSTFGRYAGFVLAPVEPERVYRIGGGFRLPDNDE